MAWARIALSAFFLFVAAHAKAIEDDVYVLVHPKCPLVPDDLLKTQHGKAESAHKALLMKGDRPPKTTPYAAFHLEGVWAKFVSGSSLKDVPRAERCYILELLPTKVVPVKNATSGKLAGDVVNRPIPFTDVHLYQPFKLWYSKGPDAELVLLGEKTVDLYFSRLVVTDSGMTGTLLPGTAGDLARKGLVEIFEQLGKPVMNSYMPRILTSKPVPSSGINSPLQEPPTVIKASRVTKEKDGITIIEVDLHNRLPVWATCSLRRELNDAERSVLPLSKKETKETLASRETYLQNVVLAPGEKKTAKFVVSPLPAGVKMMLPPRIEITAGLSNGTHLNLPDSKK